MAKTNSNPNNPTPGSQEPGDPFITGDELLERAKNVARKIESRIRELTDDTKANQPSAQSSDESTDPTDEMPPIR